MSASVWVIMLLSPAAPSSSSSSGNEITLDNGECAGIDDRVCTSSDRDDARAGIDFRRSAIAGSLPASSGWSNTLLGGIDFRGPVGRCRFCCGVNVEWRVRGEGLK